MKKVVCAVAILAAAGMGFSKVNEKIYKANVIKSEPCEYQKVWVSENPYKYRGEITYSQMQEDLQNLKYILQTCYAGYEKACERGLNLDEVMAQIEAKFTGQETVYSRDIAKAFYEETKKYIIDAHFKSYLGNSELRFCEHENIYYSDIYIENEEADSFNSEEGALFPYYKNGKEMLRVGRFSVEPVTEVSSKLNGKSQKQPVRLYPCDSPSYKPVLVEKESAQTAYIRLESFMPNETKASDINLKKFMDAGLRYLDKSNVIVDLRTNNGGFLKYVDSFIKGFLFNYSKITSEEVFLKIENTYNKKRAELKEDCFTIISPGTVQLEQLSLEIDKIYKKQYKNYVSHWTKPEEKKLQMFAKWMKNPSKKYLRTNFIDENLNLMAFPKQPAFKGRMFVLIDRNSVSAAEDFILMTKKCLGEDVVIVIGENSFGSIEFGALADYSLPNSELSFHIAKEACYQAMEKLSNWHGEGKGVYPDIWSTDEDMLETLVAVTGDEGLRKALAGMN